MRLKQYTDYALRVLMYAGAREDTLVTISEVAQAYGVSRHHLVKVVNQLGVLGYVETVRGRGGGFRLGCAPAEISVGEVVRHMEGCLDIVDCAGTGCPILGPCRLRPILGEARDAFLAVLDRYTLADLTANRGDLLLVLSP